MITTSIGQGTATLVLRTSENAYRGDALYKVTLDGAPVGGTLAAHAVHGAGQPDIVTIRSDLALGEHRLAVTFLNDLWGGTPQTDRNLYVDALVVAGTLMPGSAASLFSPGTSEFRFQVTAPPAPAFPVIGADTIPNLLQIDVSQDRYLEDARYVVRVDGTPIDGVQTATAWHAAGQHDTLSIRGAFGPGHHVVTVDYLNDRWDGTPSTDRNLYVDAMRIDGKSVLGSAVGLFSPGARDFAFDSPPISINQPVGTGADALVLKISEDFYQDFARYAVRVDGIPIGGTLTAGAYHGSGLSDTLTVRGDWAAGPHVLTVEFLNDAYGGTAATDRNLHVEGITFNGTALPDSEAVLYSAGSHDFLFNA